VSGSSRRVRCVAFVFQCNNNGLDSVDSRDRNSVILIPSFPSDESADGVLLLCQWKEQIPMSAQVSHEFCDAFSRGIIITDSPCASSLTLSQC
jgi:hypothetical protein